MNLNKKIFNWLIYILHKDKKQYLINYIITQIIFKMTQIIKIIVKNLELNTNHQNKIQ